MEERYQWLRVGEDNLHTGYTVRPLLIGYRAHLLLIGG